jgi:hypothetical protein
MKYKILNHQGCNLQGLGLSFCFPDNPNNIDCHVRFSKRSCPLQSVHIVLILLAVRWNL